MVIKNLLCLAGGVAIGYYVAHSRLEKMFDERLQKEIADSHEFYSAKYAKKAAKDYVNDEEFLKEAIRASKALSEYAGVSVDPTALVENLSDIVERNQQDIPEEEESEPEDSVGDPGDEYWERWKEEQEAEKVKPAPPVSIVPEQPKGAVDYNRISTEPKIEDPAEAKVDFTVIPIDKKEFDENDLGFSQSEMTYFIGDDILANLRDEVVTEEARREFLGDEIFDLLKTPEARGGETTVYARNVPKKREFLIAISTGNYKDEVGEVVYATE